MRKKEIIAFSIFGFLLALIRLIQNLLKTKSLAIGQPFINKSIPNNIYEQMQVLNNYYSIATITWNILAIFSCFTSDRKFYMDFLICVIS